MTRPGDPGYAAAARASVTASTPAVDAAGGNDAAGTAEASEASIGSSTDAPSRRHPWTLHRRLLVIVAALLVAVSAAIGVVTVLVFHSSSVERLDASLRATASRATS